MVRDEGRWGGKDEERGKILITVYQREARTKLNGEEKGWMDGRGKKE